MKKEFEIAGGSIVGTDHLGDKVLLGRNNHDAFHVVHNSSFSLAIICDGCGTGEHSEVGSKMGAVLLAARLSEYLRRICDSKFEEVTAELDTYLERARQDVLAHIRTQAMAMGGSLSETITNYFLFTVLGVIVCKDWTAIFSIGDGVFILNDETVVTTSGESNEPIYMAYEITGTTIKSANLKFQVQRLIKTEHVQRVLIGTDGAAHFNKVHNRKVPGREEFAGGLSQFFSPQYFENPDAIRRRLAVLNTRKVRMNPARDGLTIENGLLPDDTTLVAISRRTSVGG